VCYVVVTRNLNPDAQKPALRVHSRRDTSSWWVMWQVVLQEIWRQTAFLCSLFRESPTQHGSIELIKYHEYLKSELNFYSLLQNCVINAELWNKCYLMLYALINFCKLWSASVSNSKKLNLCVFKISVEGNECTKRSFIFQIASICVGIDSVRKISNGSTYSYSRDLSNNTNLHTWHRHTKRYSVLLVHLTWH
jgi:hypothetical protein